MVMAKLHTAWLIVFVSLLPLAAPHGNVPE